MRLGDGLDTASTRFIRFSVKRRTEKSENRAFSFAEKSKGQKNKRRAWSFFSVLDVSANAKNSAENPRSSY
jgi:hypothetical protein